MLIRSEHLKGIEAGEISLAFRRWVKPPVRSGGTLRTAIGTLAIEVVDPVPEAEITEEEARIAGFGSLAELLAELGKRPEGVVYRIQLHLAGPDSRIALREQKDLDDAESARLQARLERLDRIGQSGPWTLAVLRSLATAPGRRAADLAAELHLEKDWLKVNIRKLKELGLTESLQIGYRLSPRGQALYQRLQG